MFQFEFDTRLLTFTAPPQSNPLLQLPSTIAEERENVRADAHKIRLSFVVLSLL
jgi:hypothetical protein